MKPVPMTRSELIVILIEILNVVGDSDSFEGSLEYLMPSPPEDHSIDLNEEQKSFVSCRTCGVRCDSMEDLQGVHDGDPVTTRNGERTDFMVRASYRTGNSQGQGGIRLIGEMRS